MVLLKEEQVLLEAEDQMWSARERTIIARTKQYLEVSYSATVEVGELEHLLGHDDVDVDFRRLLKEARDERGGEIFETFSTFCTDGLSELMVADRSRWDKYKKKMERTMETKIRRPLQVKDGGKKARTAESRLEFDRKKG